MSNSYIKDNLIAEFNTNDIDISDLSLISTRKWDNTKINTTNIKDYGLNQYDIGFSEDLKDDKDIIEKKLTLYRLGEPSGNTVNYLNYEINLQSFPSIGDVLMLNGGYLLNSFKYHQYEVEYLPRQYNNGFTFETTILITGETFTNVDDNSNIFLYLGARAEDKFANSYTGNTVYQTKEGATLFNSYRIYDLSQLKENTQNIESVTTVLTKLKLYIKSNGQLDFIIDDLITTDIDIIYNGTLLVKDTDYTIDIRNKKISLLNIDTVVSDELYVNYYKLIDEVELVNIDLSKIDNFTYDLEHGVQNNVIGFKFDKLGRIGYRKIDDNRNIEEDYSQEQAAYNGWNHIIITFKPDELYSEDKLIDDNCPVIARKGKLSIYVNGIEFYKNEDFLEPALNPYPIDKSKQIGLPYTISWGGGSVGLKHSYNLNGIDQNLPYEINQINEDLLIQKNFDGYFKGGINKLRIYNKYFTLSEIRNNYRFESEFYNIIYNKGGRLIYANDYTI
jgi:hypothetical protein